MKHYATFFLIAVMSLGLVFLLLTRDRTKHDAPAEIIEVKETKSEDAGADADSADASAVPLAAADAGVAAIEASVGDKPLRVATLGWELAAPGAGIPALELAPESELSAIEARLARGGGDPQGAEVAVLPLPSFVASYERLRALEPRVFLVVGFSRGREQVHANPGALLRVPPGADEVKLVRGNTESATVLALFAVDLLGVAPSRLRLVGAETPEGKAAAFAGVGTTDPRKLAFSTVDASHFVPIVAFAPKAVIDAREDVLRSFAKGWLEGQGKVAADVPGVARKLAAKDPSFVLGAGVGGAPEALVLVERLGLLERTTLEDETSILGPLAKAPANLDALMTKTWQLARGGGLTTTAAPEPLPIDARVITGFAPAPKTETPAPPPEEDAGAAAFGPLPAGAVPLVLYRATAGDADAVATQLRFLSGVFDRAYFKVTAKGGEKAAKAIAEAARDKGVPATRLATAAGEPAGALAAVEVLAPP
ncbi:MAG: hypothetical protein KIT84_25615 [Labilithrix sp.]|nr:hypothetical protein [Labilithrix sp.]MCW5814431.1 hypothetical protein [Labilithrix sp.]